MRSNSSGSWVPARTLAQARYDLNVCLHTGMVFVVGGGHPSFEIYDPRFDSLKTIHPVPLPIDPDVSITVSHKSKLVMISASHVYRYDHFDDRLETTQRTGAGIQWSNTVPVVSGKALFVVRVTGARVVMEKLGVYTGRVLSQR